jgi:hypothetical protein
VYADPTTYIFDDANREDLPVDTHVHRVATRVGLAPAAASRETAYDVMNATAPAHLKHALHILLIKHGTKVTSQNMYIMVCDIVCSCVAILFQCLMFVEALPCSMPVSKCAFCTALLMHACAMFAVVAAVILVAYSQQFLSSVFMQSCAHTDMLSAAGA